MGTNNNHIRSNEEDWESQAFTELIRIMSHEDNAREIVIKAGFPREHVPTFRSSYHFWVSIARDIADGMEPGTLLPIIEIAAGLYPHNHKFAIPPPTAFLNAQREPQESPESLEQIVLQHTENLDVFLEEQTGAVIEDGRLEGGRSESAFRYSEATGLIIRDLLFLASLTNQDRFYHFEDKANRAARWVTTKALDPSGGVLTRDYLDGSQGHKGSFGSREIYTFDTAVCLSGIVNYIQISGGNKDIQNFLSPTHRMAEFLINLESEGSLPATYNARSRSHVKPNLNSWSEQSGIFQAVIGCAILEYSSLMPHVDIKKADAARQAAIRILDCIASSILSSDTSEKFETTSGVIHVHPLCYAAEGLLRAHTLRPTKTWLAASKKIVRWLIPHIDNNGHIPQEIRTTETSTGPVRYRTDSLAQLLSLIADLGLVDVFIRQAKRLELAIRAARRKGSFFLSEHRHIPATRSFFCYGYYENGEEAKTLSSWTNIFCVQALIKYSIEYARTRAHLLVLAGGEGSRCWPLSTRNSPKALSKTFLATHSLLQETLMRYGIPKHDDDHISSLLTSEVMTRPPARASVVVGRESAYVAGAQLVPYGDITIPEDSPQGTVAAIELALSNLHKHEDRILIISMSDNVIRPHEAFRRALSVALMIASQEDAFVSVGMPFSIGRPLDSRFGYMGIDTTRWGPFSASPVIYFEEKPSDKPWCNNKKRLPRWAIEGGTIVVKQRYFEGIIGKLRSPKHAITDLAYHILQQTSKESVRMYVSLLPGDVQFEDFGTPGSNLRDFFRDEIDPKDGDNLTLGRRGCVQFLHSYKNTVIAERRDVDVQDLEGYYIVDGLDSRIAVITTEENSGRLDQLQGLCSETEGVGPDAMRDSLSQDENGVSIENSPLGKMIQWQCRDPIAIDSTPERLYVRHAYSPKLEPEDFKVLYCKQQGTDYIRTDGTAVSFAPSDPEIAYHVLHVASFAQALLEYRKEGIPFNYIPSRSERRLLSLISLYHDIGGFLGSKENVDLEKEFREKFGPISALDFRRLDLDLVEELIRCSPEQPKLGIASVINDSTNSIRLFLRVHGRDKDLDPSIRDLVVKHLQLQDSGKAFREWAESLVSDSDEWRGRREKLIQEGHIGDVARMRRIFACLKIADIFANGQWRWKREQSSMMLIHEVADLVEDYAATVRFALSWLDDAGYSGAERSAYLMAINDLLATDSHFRFTLHSIRGGATPSDLDKIYEYVFFKGSIREGGVTPGSAGEGARNFLKRWYGSLVEDGRVRVLGQMKKLGEDLFNLVQYSPGNDRLRAVIDNISEPDNIKKWAVSMD